MTCRGSLPLNENILIFYFNTVSSESLELGGYTNSKLSELIDGFLHNFVITGI
jgi:hypothetical protein